MNAPAVRPLSLMNVILFVIALATLAAAVARGSYAAAVMGAVVVASIAASVQRARRGQGSVNERVSAFQPYDERDRDLLARSYSILGQAVFVAQSVMLLVALLADGDVDGETYRFLAVCAIAIIATTVTVRRG